MSPIALYEKLSPLDERIIDTPAKTLAGFRAKARAIMLTCVDIDDFEETFGPDTPHQLAGSLMRDLLQLAP